MDQFSLSTKSTMWHRVVHEYRVTLLPLRHSPATWTFGAAWLLSEAYLLLSGYGGDVLPSLGLVFLIVVLSLLTLPLTSGFFPFIMNREAVRMQKNLFELAVEQTTLCCYTTTY